jgi:ketosteroid isomerase-like protein
MNYADFIAQYNSGDDAYLIQRYFADDCIYICATQFLRGHEALLRFLEHAHDGVREILRPQLVLQDERHIFAEIDVDFHAYQSRTDFPFGSLLPGDTRTVKSFVVYRLRDGKIAELRTATWPPAHRVSKSPRLGGDVGQRAAFHAYTRAFSEAQLERIAAFYTEDVTLEWAAQAPMRGRDVIIDYYRTMFQSIRANLTVHHLIADHQGIAADMTMRYLAIKDAPEFVIMPLAQGEAISGRVFMHYTLREGLISHIQVARRGEMVKETRTSSALYAEPATRLPS